MMNPISAVTHPNPYPYYAELVAERPVYFDDGIGFWVASSAEAVTAALTSEICRVRPASEPVPKVLLGSPAATIFQHLARMTDGKSHCPLKQGVSNVLEAISIDRVAEQSDRWSRVLADELRPHDDHRRISDFAFRLPVYVIASMLGIPENELPRTAVWMSEFVRCMTLVGTPEQIEKGKVFAGHLFEMVKSIVERGQPDSRERLPHDLSRELDRLGVNDKTIVVANAVGFLFQVYEATAGLIGNTLVALSDHQTVREQVAAEPGLLAEVIDEVVRYDPSAQMTRRFVGQDGIVAGQNMKEGDTILALFAAANRDPELNPHPQRFDIQRKDRRSFTFGFGIHACPGAHIAKAIAASGVKTLLDAGLDVELLCGNFRYRESLTLRIPLFDR